MYVKGGMAGKFTYFYYTVNNKYTCAPISADSVSVFSVICGSPQPEKNLENLRNKQFISFKM
jgi:hypothetical protein